jgi:integrase
MNDILEKMNSYLDASLAPNTKKAYASDWKAFCDYCAYRSIDCLPSSSHNISLYLTELASSGKTIATIVRAATSINKAHELAGHPPIWNEQIRLLLSGMKKRNERGIQKAKALSYRDIISMTTVCDSTIMGTRDRALLWVGWCSAMRRAELVALNIGDIEWFDAGVVVTIRRSKTDQNGKGRKIGIPYSDDLEHCPVRALLAWLKRLPADFKEPDKPLFLAIGMSGYRSWFPVHGINMRLTDRSVSLIVKKYARLAGIPNASSCSAHSLRRGLATEAASREVPERIIARHTGHEIDDGRMWIDNPLAAIYRPCSAHLLPSGEQ